MSDRLNTIRPAPLVVLSNAGNIIQAEKYRSTFPEERLKESPFIQEIPNPPDTKFHSFDIFSPTGNDSRSPFPNQIYRIQNRRSTRFDNSSPIQRVVETKESTINIRKKNIVYFAFYCNRCYIWFYRGEREMKANNF